MSTYTRTLVEQLLPAVWDSSSAYGMDDPTAPDPDMPRATVDPSHGGTLLAHLADIKTGWTCAYIPLRERQAMILRYGMGLTHAEIGQQLGVSRQAIAERLTEGVGRLVEYLNGDATWEVGAVAA